MYLIISILFLSNSVMSQTKDINNNLDIKLNNKCWNNRETQNDLSLCYNDAFSFWKDSQRYCNRCEDLLRSLSVFQLR